MNKKTKMIKYPNRQSSAPPAQLLTVLTTGTWRTQLKRCNNQAGEKGDRPKDQHKADPL